MSFLFCLFAIYQAAGIRSEDLLASKNIVLENSIYFIRNGIIYYQKDFAARYNNFYLVFIIFVMNSISTLTLFLEYCNKAQMDQKDMDSNQSLTEDDLDKELNNYNDEEPGKLGTLLISPSLVSVSPDPLSTLYLDTKGACFFCGEKILCEKILCEKKDYQIEEKSLRKLCHYLGIKQSSILSTLHETLEKNEKIEDNLIKCDFSVTLCQNCANIEEKLSKLFEQLELTKMLIDYQTQVFHNILRNSVGNIDNKDDNRKISFNDPEFVNSRLVKSFRKEIMQNCK